MLRRTLGMALRSTVGPVQLWCAPQASHPAFREFSESERVSLHSQIDGDLGQRMLHAARGALRDSFGAILMGADCPALDADELCRIQRLLSGGCRAVLVGAEDGGYVSLGLRRATAGLFTGIPWGGPDVLSTTRARLCELGWSWLELAPLWDVDRVADLARLHALDAGLLHGLSQG